MNDIRENASCYLTALRDDKTLLKAGEFNRRKSFQTAQVECDKLCRMVFAWTFYL